MAHVHWSSKKCAERKMILKVVNDTHIKYLFFFFHCVVSKSHTSKSHELSVEHGISYTKHKHTATCITYFQKLHRQRASFCGQVESNIIGIIDVWLTCPHKKALCRCNVRKQEKYVAWCVCVSVQKSCWTLSTCDVLRRRFAATVKGGNIYCQIFHFAHRPLFFADGTEMHFQKRNTLWIYDVITKCVYINLGFPISI